MMIKREKKRKERTEGKKTTPSFVRVHSHSSLIDLSGLVFKNPGRYKICKMLSKKNPPIYRNLRQNLSCNG